jgi:hypothetical protein
LCTVVTAYGKIGYAFLGFIELRGTWKFKWITLVELQMHNLLHLPSPPCCPFLIQEVRSDQARWSIMVACIVSAIAYQFHRVIHWHNTWSWFINDISATLIICAILHHTWSMLELRFCNFVAL